MHAPLLLVDAFADAAFTGNPAAVCLLHAPADPTWMQQVAMEMNQAETAFLWPIAGGLSLRWFTPAVEIDLCGHATLASAHALWERDDPRPELRFSTRSGWLVCRKDGARIAMDFPAEPAHECAAPPELDALGARPVQVARNRMDFLVELASEKELRELRPDLARIARIDARGVVVTARSSGAQDFVSRCFFPQSGIPEDSVTGSAHCALGPYWGARLGKDQVVGYQASPRGGFVEVRVRGARVELLGSARTVLAGELRT